MALQDNSGSFVPTTNIWDAGSLYEVDVTSKDFKELLIHLYQNINKISLSLNTRDAGYYTEQEFINGQLFPGTAHVAGEASPELRQVFRKLIKFGALPNTATKSVAHNITVNNNLTFTRIYGASSNKVAHTYLPLPYASPVLNQNISLLIDSTNIIIATGINRASFTDTWIIVEFLKS